MRSRPAPRASVSPIRLEPPVVVVDSDCCCPLAPGRCRAPYDLQPAVLTGHLDPLSGAQQAAAALAGSVLEHLRKGRPMLAVHHTEWLEALLDDI